MTPGAKVGRKGDHLEVTAKEVEPQRYPVQEVGQVVLHGFAQITTQALRLCAEREVGVHWVTMGGGTWGPGRLGLDQCNAASGSIKLSPIRQSAYNWRSSWLKRRAGQLSVLLRPVEIWGGRLRQSRLLSVVSASSCNPPHRAESLDSLRGYEGSIAAQYFSALPDLIAPEVSGLMRPDGRNRRPPRDRCNALLSFGYALLLKDVMNAILVVGLDPALGFYHQPRSQAHPLALDLLELFRVPLVDLPVASINRRQWDESEDFRSWTASVTFRSGSEKFTEHMNVARHLETSSHRACVGVLTAD